jgi:nucleotide-binding universal stress UspA family protein
VTAAEVMTRPAVTIGGMLVGSVSIHCVTSAACPVVVVPSE